MIACYLNVIVCHCFSLANNTVINNNNNTDLSFQLISTVPVMWRVYIYGLTAAQNSSKMCIWLVTSGCMKAKVRNGRKTSQGLLNVVHTVTVNCKARVAISCLSTPVQQCSTSSTNDNVLSNYHYYYD